MAEEESNESKVHEPTEKRLREARRKGDVPSSRETGNMMVVASLLGVVAFALPWQSGNLVHALSLLVEGAGNVTITNGQAGVNELGEVMTEFILALVIALSPVFLLLIIGALTGVLIQGETVASLERIRPKISKISVIEGFKRLFSKSALVEFAKNILKICVAGALALWVANEAVVTMMSGIGFLPETLPTYLMDAARKLLIAMAVFLVPLAIADILWRRYDWRKKHMMTHKELRDELKEAEGSPELKAKRAERRREQSRQRVAVAVPTADVVLTNPTHFAVALKYQADSDIAPVCVAKGADQMAHRIRAIAFENDVPVIENKPLARLLYDEVELEDVVPVEHWQVVAEIIGFVMDLKKGKRRKLPEGSMLRSIRDEM